MKKTLLTTIALCIIGCGDADAKTPEVTEVKSVPNIIMVKNTETISYHLYRQAWRKANDKPAQRWAPDPIRITNVDDDKETVELFLDDLSFKNAFRLEFLGKGEGRTFWWRGNEYTTNLLDVVHKPVTTTPVPVDHEDLREGGGDQGTIE